MATKNILLLGDSLVDYLASIGPFTTVREAYDYDRAHPGSGYFDLRSVAENSWAPKFADAWTSATPGDVPKFINTGVAGTKLIGNWNAAGATRTQAEAWYVDAGSPSLDMALMIVGANDVMTGSTVSTATYVTAIQSVKAWLSAAPFNGTPQLYLAIISQASSSGFVGGDSNVDFITRLNGVRQAVLDAVTAGHCALGANLTGQAYGDNVHPDTTLEAEQIGYGFYLAITGTPAPRITAASVNAAKTIVHVTNDRALSNTVSSSIGGFRAMDNGVVVTLSGETVLTSTMEELVFPPASGTVTIGFAQVRDAVGQTMPVGVAQSVNGTTYAPPLIPVFNMAVSAAGFSPSPSPSASASASTSPSLSASASASPSASPSSSVSPSPSSSASRSASASQSPSSSASPSPSPSAPEIPPDQEMEGGPNLTTYQTFGAVSPSNTVDQRFRFDAIYVGAAGNVAVVSDGNYPAVVFANAPTGLLLRVHGRRINATGTTATNLIALKKA